MGVYRTSLSAPTGSATSFAGATKVAAVGTRGEPAHVPPDAVSSHQADLVAVGNRGLNPIAGRILGSLPAETARHSGVDVLIVRTT